MLDREGLCALRDSFGNRKLASGEDFDRTDLDFRDGALVSDGELANIGDFIAPEFHADRVVQGGWENVDDATAHGKLAALGHHVHARIGTEF